MLNLENKDRVQTLYIPRNGAGAGEDYALEVKGTSENHAVPLRFTIGAVVVTGSYFQIVAELPEGLHAGEWEYGFLVDGVAVSRGLLSVGDEVLKVVQYEKKTEYKEYAG